MLGRWTHFLFKEEPIYPLVTFRIVFGFLMFISTLRFIYLGWIPEHFIDTQFQFKYYGFEWVGLLPPFWMYVVHGLMLFSALGVMLGFLYRFSAALMFLTFTYIELIDLTYYLNHYYFISLVSLLLIFIPANKYLSFDARIWPEMVAEKTAAWHINLIKFQIFVVYFFAGIAKMNYDWLMDALPMKIWLPAHDTVPVLGDIFSHEWAPYAFSWLGMFYDTFIVFFLLFKPTRPIAYIAVVLFHLTVGILFQIGVFPVVMIGVTLIFFSAAWHQRILSFFVNLVKFKVPNSYALKVKQGFMPKPLLALLISSYVLFQLVFPLRYLAYPGNLFWTEEGYRFSWRVMLMEKAGTATFYVKDKRTGREGIVDNGEFLNAHQEKQMAFQPDMILQYAHFLGQYYQNQGVLEPEVRVKAWVTLNARPSQLIVDPNVDLMEVKDSWQKKDWILPFTDNN
ncbi:HTTM domain-containing protein [Arcticibacterium luteifluviistationis]|uniref:HTTM domain-containing protein n=1 Tax=Arcticibacterium luteifluviistationis TaxID=1784714 RepID=A0A2Z4G934_9BACT|nr:HTTM domain-containing protein [Arcticibacterium luteifluviistationis]AWV97759.1 HTTM domain-containing protein [Arcticibacterium luteifluviistationis]